MCDNCKRPDPELIEGLEARPLVQVHLTAAGATAVGFAPTLSQAQGVLLLSYLTARLQAMTEPPTADEQTEVRALIASWKLDDEKRQGGGNG